MTKKQLTYAAAIILIAGFIALLMCGKEKLAAIILTCCVIMFAGMCIIIYVKFKDFYDENKDQH